MVAACGNTNSRRWLVVPLASFEVHDHLKAICRSQLHSVGDDGIRIRLDYGRIGPSTSQANAGGVDSLRHTGVGCADIPDQRI